MIESIFFLYVALSIVSFGVQLPLMVYCARKHNPLIVVVYRNFSYILTMSPLLIFLSMAEVFQIFDHIPVLLISAGFGALAFISSLKATTYLPVGINSSFNRSASLLTAIGLSYLFLQEVLTHVQLLLVCLLLVTVIALSIIRSTHAHLDPDKTRRGIMFAVVGGIFAAAGFFFFADLAQSVHPFVAGYFWEVTIGFFAFVYLIIMYVFGRYKENFVLPIKETLQISIFALPAISGTIFFALAVNHGPFVLASSLTIASVAVTTLFSWLLFKERLRFIQLVLIGAVIILIYLIRTAS